MAEALTQIKLAMGKVSKQQTILDAKANIKKTWEELFGEAKITNREKILLTELSNPYHPVTILCLFIY